MRNRFVLNHHDPRAFLSPSDSACPCSCDEKWVGCAPADASRERYAAFGRRLKLRAGRQGSGSAISVLNIAPGGTSRCPEPGPRGPRLTSVTSRRKPNRPSTLDPVCPRSSLPCHYLRRATYAINAGALKMIEGSTGADQRHDVRVRPEERDGFVSPSRNFTG